MGAVMFGNGLSGIGTNILRSLTLLIWPSDKNENNEFYGALALYLLAAFIIGMCSVASSLLKKNEFATFYLSKIETGV